MAGKKKISKVLIANRGEIAVRIIRACKEMGLKTVSVYSDADFNSLHVRLSDEVIHIGESPANESYLRIDKIIKAAEISGADGLHPGYGFLAENPELAKACESKKIAYIGPNPDVIKSLGEKTTAKGTMIQAGIPTIPGVHKEVQDIDEARSIAGAIGYPVIIKSTMGGGGRGMRIVNNEKELVGAFHFAKSEALAAFGSDAVFVEKLIVNPRHIEFQILADYHGNVVHLGERDCTLQRRNQKLIEEAPSPFIDNDMRQRMGYAAVAAAKAANYNSAGTVEFLVDSENNFYFMEMNTRIQVEHPVTEMVTGVEHPVTEMVTGIDLIKEQIRIAQEEKLTFAQNDVKIKGWAMECRINAEDPFHNFIPNPGIVKSIRFPLGPGIRVDTAVFNGYEIPRQYDSLIAKIIVHADNRHNAINRMFNALSEMKIDGIKTTREFLLILLNNKDFIRAQHNTSYVEYNINKLTTELQLDEQSAAVAAAIDVFLKTQKMHSSKSDGTSVDKKKSVSSWRMCNRIHEHGR